MRSKPSSPTTVLVIVMVLLSGAGVASASAAPGPLDSSPDHEAGYLNTTFTDSLSNELDLTVFYPARTEGENATKDVTGAPYPHLMIVHQPDIGPAFRYWSSYGEHLSRMGYTVGILDLGKYDPGNRDDYANMSQAVLDAVDDVVGMDDTPGAKLYGMVNESAVTLAGHGQGGFVAVLAAGSDDNDRVHAVATMAMVHWPTAGEPPWNLFMGPLEMPFMFLEVSTSLSYSGNAAFDAKARGYASLLEIEGGNFSQFMNNASFEDSSDPPADIDHTEQLNLTKRYLLAFLDLHMKEDAMAASRLYGSQAAADLADGTLSDWRYGVLDQTVVSASPDPGARLPTGPLSICATVSNLGPFPMPLRNVTLQLAKVLPGPVYQMVYGPENRSTPAQPVGTSTAHEWNPTITVYGDYVAFIEMGDPDHNSTNDRVELPFSLVPLLSPTIDHEPPDTLELGEAYNLTCRIGSPTGVARAFVDYSDEEGFRRELNLTEDTVSGLHYVHLPAPRTVGNVDYRIHVRAVSGATNSTNPFYIAVVDTIPPAMEHVQGWTLLPVLAEVTLNATVTDVGGIDQVRLVYTEPSTGFHNVTCGRDGDVWFYPLVLGPTSGDLVYSWYSVDTWGNEAVTPDYTVALVDDEPPSIEPSIPNPVELGDDLTLEARVTDSSLLSGVWVVFARPGEGGPVNGTPVSVGSRYRLSVTNLSTAGDLVYSWWARDVNGQTSTTGDLSVEVRDTVPPEVTEVYTGDAEVGLQPWVRVTVTDAAGSAIVVLEYVQVSGEPGTAAMEEVQLDVYEARMPAQAEGGAMTYRVVATDPAGNAGDSGNRTLVVRDTEPPVISHVPPRDLVEGQEVTFAATVTDNVGVTEVWLYLRLSASGTYRRLAMEAGEGDVYTYILEAGELLKPHVSYYVEAEDAPPSSNLVTEPATAPDTTYLLNVTDVLITLHGVVKASGGDPVQGARVKLVGNAEDGRTDSEGMYEIPGLVAGPYILKVTADGHEDFTANLVLSADSDTRELDVSLVPKVSDDGGDEGLPWTMIAALVIFAVIAVLVIVFLRSGTRGG